MSKSNTTICAARKCYSSLVTHSSKSFFGFPSDISLCKTWLENCGRTDLNLQKVSKRSHWRLCEDHFEDKWFTDSSRKMLKRKLNPVPTIFVNNINSLLPLGTEQEAIDVDCTSNYVDHLCVQPIEEANDDLCDYAFDLREHSLKKKQLPISYNTKPLLKSVETSIEAAKETLIDFNSDTELHNIDNICRFCLNEVYFNYIDMFSKADDAKEIRKVSEIVLPTKISICDGLPHKVCQQCTVDLKTCWKLIERFQNADQYLRSIAKYSLFIENEDVTEMGLGSEGLKSGINDDDFIKPIQTTAMVLPLSPITKTLKGSYEYLDEIKIGASLKVKNDLSLSKYNKTSTNSDAQNSNSLEISESEDTANKLSSNLKRYKQFLNTGSKCYKKCKKIPSEQIINKIIVMAQDHLDYDPRVGTANHMSNCGIIKSIKELHYKCTECSELFNSDKTLGQHLKIVHDK